LKKCEKGKLAEAYLAYLKEKYGDENLKMESDKNSDDRVLPGKILTS